MPRLFLPKTYKKKNPKNYGKFNNDNHRWVYNTDTWRDLRIQFLSENPICAECKKQGKYVSAVEVHHIRHISEFKDKLVKQFWGFNKDNLMSLCNEHHKLQHQRRTIVSEAKLMELQRIQKLISEFKNENI